MFYGGGQLPKCWRVSPFVEIQAPALVGRRKAEVMAEGSGLSSYFLEKDARKKTRKTTIFLVILSKIKVSLFFCSWSIL